VNHFLVTIGLTAGEKVRAKGPCVCLAQANGLGGGSRRKL